MEGTLKHHIVDFSRTRDEEYQRLIKVPTNIYYVYLIKCDKYYKIGYSSNPATRLQGMQTNNPFPLKLVWKAKVSNYMQIEKLLHDKFKSKRVKGEWFELSKEDIKYIKSL